MARYEARCLTLRDGDTFICHYRNVSRVPGFKNTTETDPYIAVRLLGIQCPEKKDPGGPEATAFALAWFREHAHEEPNEVHNLWLDATGYDHFGRLLGMPSCPRDGSNLNAELMENGHATVYRGTLDRAVHRRGLLMLANEGIRHAHRMLTAFDAEHMR